jgi:hypothetical protein
MRNANVQRENSMVRVSALQQPPAPHVSHAEIGGRSPLRSSPHRAWRTTDANRIERKTKIPARFSSELLLKGHREGEENLATPRARKHHDGQRCALLTTKSRNTCTRATVFNSSG